jgi:uncharacterized protein (TIGR03083 family)
MTLEERVRANVKRVAALLQGADGTRPIPDMEWTVAEAAAHIVAGTKQYTAYFQGEPSAVTDPSQVPPENAKHLAAYPERDPAKIAADLGPAYDALLAAYNDLGPDGYVAWQMGSKVGADDILGLLLGELVVHGDDIARGLGKPRDIDAEDARQVLGAALAVAPLYVDPEKSAGLNGVIRAKLRGGTTVGLTWKDGELIVGDAPAKADCTISADPVAFLLTSFGRGSKWKPILTGKVVSYGRRPLLALSLQKALRSP